MEAMLQQDLIDSAWRRRLFHYIYLLIPLIFFSYWMFLALHLLNIYMAIEYRKRYKKESTQLKRKILSIFIQQSINRLYPHQISSGFEATGLLPLSPERVLSKLQKTPTLPSTSHSNYSTQSFSVGKTPANLHQLEYQKKKIMSFKQHVDVLLSVVDKAMEKIIKDAEITIQNALLL